VFVSIVNFMDSQRGGEQGGHGSSLNVKKEKIKKKFLEDTQKKLNAY